MLQRIASVWVALVLGLAGGAGAQGVAWVQIEAQPTLREAEARARAYAGAFDDVAGFALSSGWYAIVLGPQDPGAAAARLAELLRERMVPGDSFVADGRNFRRQFWPLAVPDAPAVPARPAVPEAAAAPPAPAPAAPAPAVPAAPVETLADARRDDAGLTRAERQEIQTALQWFGHYSAAIDGAFGPGTRAAIGAWQTARGAEETGFLTPSQRAALVAAWREALAEIGLERVRDEEAGIEIDLPLGLVAFDRYEPPFAKYDERDGSGVRVLLISQPGDQSTLQALYDTLQTLDVVPRDGARGMRGRAFEISGRNPQLESFTYAELEGGLVKGFMLIWRTADAGRMARVLPAMRASFRGIGNRALDPGLVPLADADRLAMLSGTEIARPAVVRTGFFVDPRGGLVTAADAALGCGRITIDGGTEVEPVFADAEAGVAYLRPRTAVAPRGHAVLAAGLPRASAEVAVAGFAFGGALAQPSLTFGTFEAAEAPGVQPPAAQLRLAALPGDAGGPVLDLTGAVVGMLLPQPEMAGRVLPADLAFMLPVERLAGRLGEGGVPLAGGERSSMLPPEALTEVGNAMVAQVSCWR
ncbi:MAG: serine protease [Gemmobacter sp.]